MTGPTRRETLAVLAASVGTPVSAMIRNGHARGTFPQDLRVDHLRVPAGLSNTRPRFSWALAARDPASRNLRQSAARVVVADHLGTTLFDSGRILGSFPALAPERNLDLPTQMVLHWRVMVWDQEGHPSPWSATALLVTGVIEPWRGGWIAAQIDGPITAPPSEGTPPVSSAYTLPLLRRDFHLTRPVREAVISFSGLGAHALSINGRDVSTALLNPGWTDYRKTVLYETIDVTDRMTRGDNVLGVRLGGGMYDVPRIAGRYTKFVGSFGAPKLILQLHIMYDDGSDDWIVSDEQWFTRQGPILFSSIYGGEDHDARREPLNWDVPGADDEGWVPVVATTGPGGALHPQMMPGLEVAETLPTVAVNHLAPSIAVHDIGRNIAGRPRITVRGMPGTTIRITPAELLDDTGRVTQKSMGVKSGDAISFSYTLDGSGTQVWAPRFSYTGFRYLEVEGDGIVALVGERIHANLPMSGTFECSDPELNAIDGLIRAAVLSNVATILTDCPHREKLGWLEETWLNAGTVFAVFDAQPLYSKIAADIIDAQRNDGMVPSIAPEYIRFVDANGMDTPFRHSPEWGSAIIQAPWAAYRFGGDAGTLRKAYPAMTRYLAYLAVQARGGVLDVGLGDWYDIGIKPPGESQLTSRALTGTAIWYADLLAARQIASLLGWQEDAIAMFLHSATLKNKINTRFFDFARGCYDRSSQSANAMALVLGLVPDGREGDVLSCLLKDIDARGGHVSAGDIGFHYVVRALADFAPQQLLSILRRRDPPSYGAQLANGATSLTESWDANPTSSQNHFMLGEAMSWLVGNLAGISLDFARGEERALLIAPRPVASVTATVATLASPWGPVHTRWSMRGRLFDLEVNLPAGAVASIRLPRASTSEPPFAADISIGSGTHRYSTVLF